MGNYCVFAIVLLTFITVAFMWLDLRRTDSEILRRLDGRVPGEPVPVAPSYAPFKPGQCAADACAWHEAQEERRALAEDVGALVGRVDGLGTAGRAPPSARRAWVACSTDGERIGEPATLPAHVDRLALNEDEEDVAWSPRESGVWPGPRGDGG